MPLTLALSPQAGRGDVPNSRRGTLELSLRMEVAEGGGHESELGSVHGAVP